MIDKNIKYSYNDIAIVPAPISFISHRNECNVYEKYGKLPLFTAPMSSVVDENNFFMFEENGINSILPRTVDLNIRLNNSKNKLWSAYSLTEFEQFFCKENNKLSSPFILKVLVDIANGHMNRLFDLVKLSKKIYGANIEIMIGNIANPETYISAAECGADYVRLGVGAGFGCITSSNTSIHFPMASLIDETVNVRNYLLKNSEYTKDSLPKIIADGGVRNYSDAIKALALGADYVMIGGVFSKMLESSADTHKFDLTVTNKVLLGDKINQFDTFYTKNKDNLKSLKKIFYGMSTKKAQILTGKTELRTSEGIEKIVDVEYTMKSWVDNFKDYLSSAMSYTNSINLEDFKNSKIIVISNNTYNSVNK